jgi:hypothetical protein
MNSMALAACQLFFGMRTGPVHFCSIAMAGGTIWFFQFVGVGQILRITVASRAIELAVVGFPVFVMTVKAFICAE